MGTKATRVARALERAGLRAYVDAIEDNPATPGEVVLWRGGGHPVSSVREARDYVRRLAQHQGPRR